MRKCFLTAVIFCLSIVTVYAQSLPSLSVMEGVIDYGVTQADVVVSFQNNGSVSAFQFDINYDTAVLSAELVELVTSDGDHRIVSNEITPGVHRVLVYSLSNTITSNPILLTIPFSVLQNDTATLLSIQNLVLSDTTASVCTAGAINNGTITLEGPDSDGDGIPDKWELLYVVDITLMDVTTDLDLDGFKDLFEYHAGTDPTDPDSLLQIMELSREDLVSTGTAIKVTWTCEAGKTYTIFWSSMEPEAAWDEVSYTGMEADITSDGTTQSWVDQGLDPEMSGELPSGVTCRVYKVVVDQSE